MTTEVVLTQEIIDVNLCQNIINVELNELQNVVNVNVVEQITSIELEQVSNIIEVNIIEDITDVIFYKYQTPANIAEDISINTDNFDNVLGEADNTVQKALETLDNNATKTESSNINGNIKINNTEIQVYDDSNKANLNGNISEDFSAKDLYVGSSLNGINLENITTGFIEVDYTGIIDGINTIFYTDNAYTDLQIEINGIIYPKSMGDITYWTYSGITLVFMIPLPIGWNLNIKANKGVFGLTNPILLSLQSTSTLIQHLTDSITRYYELPENTYGTAIEIKNYYSAPLKIVCHGQIKNWVSVDCAINSTNIPTNSPSFYQQGQSIIFNGESPQLSLLSTVDSVNSEYIILKEPSSMYIGQGTSVKNCYIIDVPPYNANGSSVVSLNNIAVFREISIFSAGQYEVSIYGGSITP